MTRWILMPYDGSPVARATLHRAAQSVRAINEGYGGVILALAGVEPSRLAPVLDEAQRIAGANVPLEARLLNAGDPIASIQELCAALPDATFAVPLVHGGADGTAPWYIEACREGGCGQTHMLFRLFANEIAKFTEAPDERHRVGSPISGFLRACAGLRLGLHAPMRGGHV